MVHEKNEMHQYTELVLLTCLKRVGLEKGLLILLELAISCPLILLDCKNSVGVEGDMEIY